MPNGTVARLGKGEDRAGGSGSTREKPTHSGMATGLRPFSKNEHLGTGKLDRKVVFDIYCVAESGERFIVGMQKTFQLNLRDRSLFYPTYPIQEQTKRGDWDFGLKAVYCISILDFNLDQGDDRHLHRVGLIDRETGDVFSDKLNFIYVEIPKFHNNVELLETNFEKWLYELKQHLEYLERVPVGIRSKIFEKLKYFFSPKIPISLHGVKVSVISSRCRDEKGIR